MDSTANNIARSGALKPLNKYLSKYPNIQKVYDSAYWNEYTFDSNKYFLKGPIMLATSRYCTLIRQDWLDKLKLPMPTTVQEFYNVAKAFVKSEPDGKSPTYALSGRVGMGIDNFWALSPAYGNPNIDIGIPYIYVDYKTKKLALWQTSDAARAYFKEISRWWKEGLIDKECTTNTTDPFDTKINNGTVGTVCHMAESAGWRTTEIRKMQKRKEPVLTAMPALKGTGYKNPFGGEGGTEKGRAFDAYWGIPKSCKNIANVLKIFDFEASPAFNDFAVFGLEGYEYTKKNGTYVINVDYNQNKSFFDLYSFTFNMASFNKTQKDRVYARYAGDGNADYDPISDTKNGPVARSAAAYELVAKTSVPYQSWTTVIPALPVEDDYPDYQSPNTQLYVKFITGELDANKDSDWKSYLEQVKNSGILDIMKAKEAWLKKNAPKYFNKW
jgi:hypothetical protein